MSKLTGPSSSSSSVKFKLSDLGKLKYIDDKSLKNMKLLINQALVGKTHVTCSIPEGFFTKNPKLGYLTLGEAISQANIIEFTFGETYSSNSLSIIAPFLKNTKIQTLILDVYDGKGVVELSQNLPSTLKNIQIKSIAGAKEDLIRALGNLPITKLEIINCPMLKDSISALADIIPLIPLKDLNLQHSITTFEMLSILQPSIEKSNIENLNISLNFELNAFNDDFNIDVNTVKLLGQILEGSKISNCDLSGSIHTPNGFDALIDFLPRIISLKQLGLKNMSFYRLIGRKLVDDEISRLADALCKTSLEILEIGDNSLSAKGAQLLAEKIEGSDISTILSTNIPEQTYEILEQGLLTNVRNHLKRSAQIINALQAIMPDEVIEIIESYRTSNSELKTKYPLTPALLKLPKPKSSSPFQLLSEPKEKTKLIKRR